MGGRKGCLETRKKGERGARERRRGKEGGGKTDKRKGVQSGLLNNMKCVTGTYNKCNLNTT